MEPTGTVYLVDDDPALIKALTELVELIDLQAESYTSADAFLAAYEPTGPGCLVLDVRMPGLSGPELQKELAKADVRLPIIMITGHGDVRLAVEVMKLGAVEFLEKPFRTQELCDTIQKTIRLEVENWQRRAERKTADHRIGYLTPAERKVLDMVVLGKTNKMIAGELGLSVRAIEDRRSRMMRKLEVTSRAELMELAMAAESA